MVRERDTIAYGVWLDGCGYLTPRGGWSPDVFEAFLYGDVEGARAYARATPGAHVVEVTAHVRVLRPVAQC